MDCKDVERRVDEWIGAIKGSFDLKGGEITVVLNGEQYSVSISEDMISAAYDGKEESD